MIEKPDDENKQEKQEQEKIETKQLLKADEIIKKIEGTTLTFGLEETDKKKAD